MENKVVSYVKDLSSKIDNFFDRFSRKYEHKFIVGAIPHFFWGVFIAIKHAILISYFFVTSIIDIFLFVPKMIIFLFSSKDKKKERLQKWRDESLLTKIYINSLSDNDLIKRRGVAIVWMTAFIFLVLCVNRYISIKTFGIIVIAACAAFLLGWEIFSFMRRRFVKKISEDSVLGKQIHKHAFEFIVRRIIENPATRWEYEKYFSPEDMKIIDDLVKKRKGMAFQSLNRKRE